MEPPGFQELLRRAQAGDSEAMGELLAVVRPFLERNARELVDPGRASRTAFDLVQEAELRAWNKLAQFEGGADEEATVAKFRVWVLQIVRRLALDLRRHRNAERRKPPGYFVKALDAGGGEETGASRAGNLPAVTGPTASEDLRAEEEAALVCRAIDALPQEVDREIVRLYFFEQRTLRDIAERLGVAYHKVKERYRSSLRLLEERLEKLRE